MRNILIVKPSALGDIIQATAVLPPLRSAFPEAAISWLVFEHNAAIVRNHPMIERVISIDRKRSIWAQLGSLTEALRGPRFDMAIDLQGLLRSGLLSRISGSSRRVGFADSRELSPWFYTETHDLPRSGMHAVDRYVKLCERIGAPLGHSVEFPLPIRNEHRERARDIVSSLASEGPLVAICPTTKWKSKCWPTDHFASLGDRLADGAGARIVLLGAPGEKAIVAETASLMRHEVLDLSGRISVMDVAALLARADLFIGNDSGLMHLASATRTRTVALFGPTDPFRTGPYNPRATVIRTAIPCAPCFKKECATLECMRGLSPEFVAKVCLDRLSDEKIPSGGIFSEITA